MPHYLYDTVSRETIEKFEIYRALLVEWNRKTFLVQNKTFDNFWRRHVRDSLQLISFISSLENSIGDIGSGSGFPGLALAISGYSNLTLIESNQRKVFFLEEVARKTGVNVNILCGRIEKYSKLPFSIITSRACAPLPILLGYVLQSVSRETLSYCLFLKGENWGEEVKESQKNFNFIYEVFDSQTDLKGKILKIKDIQHIGKK